MEIDKTIGWFCFLNEANKMRRADDNIISTQKRIKIAIVAIACLMLVIYS